MKYIFLALFSFLMMTPLDAQSDQMPQELELRSYLIFSKYYQGGERIKKKEFHNFLKVEDDLYYPFKMGKTVSDVGDVIFVLSGTVAFLHLRNESRLKASGLEPEDPWRRAYLPAAGIGAGIGMAMHIFGRCVMKKKVTQYNQTQLTSLDFKVDSDGLGLVFSF